MPALEAAILLILATAQSHAVGREPAWLKAGCGCESCAIVRRIHAVAGAFAARSYANQPGFCEVHGSECSGQSPVCVVLPPRRN